MFWGLFPLWRASDWARTSMRNDMLFFDMWELLQGQNDTLMVRWPSDVPHPFSLPNLNLDFSLLVKVPWVKTTDPPILRSMDSVQFFFHLLLFFPFSFLFSFSFFSLECVCERERECVWEGRGGEGEWILGTIHTLGGAQHGSIPRPWDHDLSWNQESDAQPTEPSRHPHHHLLFFILFIL